MTLPTRHLGKLTTSALGYGCMGLSEFYGEPLPKEKAIGVIHTAYENGITLFDTADMYAYGENEKLVGEAIKPFRDKITLATKCGIIRRKEDPTARGIDNTPDYITKCCDESLKRLDIDIIDLFYIHRRNPETPIEVTVEALAKLVEQKKIRHIGLSEVDAETIKRAHKIHPITAIQSEYSLWTRTVEYNDVLETCKSLNIGFVPYSPLGRGFLTGAIKNPANLEKSDFRRTLPRFAEQNIDGNLKLVELIEVLAKQKNCTPAQLALAWLLAKEKFIVPLFGTKTPSRLIENLKATEINLTADDINYLNKISTEHAPHQSRYTDAAMKAYKLEE
ncbi:MAG TPA: aldo/keto reductase [Gammaproteobacteria bacterium]|nr:aldo/keto reductase [Gammaproteobacteria bacterium]